MDGKSKSTLLMILGGTAAAVGIVMIIRYFKGIKSPSDKLPDATTGTTASKPITAQSSSVWPIKNGSKGDLVKQLQAALGISADGIFGPITQTALLAQSGVKQISSQEEYNKVITALQSKPVISSKQERAKSLITQWNKGNVKLMPISNVTAYGVIEDVSGALTLNGNNILLKSNVALSRDYKPVGYTTQGYLKVEILNKDIKSVMTGSVRSLYKVDPSKLTIV